MIRMSFAALLLLSTAACTTTPSHRGGLAMRQSSSSGAMATAHPDNQPMTGANTINTYGAMERAGKHGNGLMADNDRP